MKKSNNNAQYWYGIGMFLIFILFFGFVFYCIYTLIVKAANNEFTNIALLQTLFSLFFTVVIGTLLSKSLDKRNTRQSELYKIKIDVAEGFVLVGTLLLSNPDDSDGQKQLLRLQIRAKLFFKDEVLIQMNQFAKTKGQSEFDNVVALMRKEII